MSAYRLTGKGRLTDKGRAGLKALLDADQLDKASNSERDGHRAPGWNAVVDLPDDWTETVEPPDGTTVLVGPLQEVFQRHGQTLRDGKEVGRWFRVRSTDWFTWADIAEAGRTFVALVPAPEPVTLPANLHDVVAAAIARAEKEPVVSGHYALAECVVEELRVRGWLVAADQHEGNDRG